MRDLGIGLPARLFADTILGLNQSLKVGKFFLAGAFGQGGSTALSFSPYTLIVSRPQALRPDQAEDVAFTIVRFNEGDANTEKHGRYEYLVSARTSTPFRVAKVSLAKFPAGTLVRHVRMDLGKFHAGLESGTDSLWYLVNHYLFDPVLPVTVADERPRAAAKARLVAGNHQRLAVKGGRGQDQNYVEYARNATIRFGRGNARLDWWVISNQEPEPAEARKHITNYVLPGNPVILTFNGQKQGQLPNTLIRNDLRLPYLEKYLIVQVACDGLDGDARRQLFSTTREALRESGLLDDLRAQVVEKLGADRELRRLDEARKSRYLGGAQDAASARLNKRLADRVRTYQRAAGDEGVEGDPAGLEFGPDELQERPAVPVSPEPTLLQLLGPSPKPVHAGRPFHLNFRTDANPALFATDGAFTVSFEPPTFAVQTGAMNVRDGYSTLYFKADAGLAVGAKGRVTLALQLPTGPTLSACTDLVVTEAPPSGKAPAARRRRPALSVVRVSTADAYFREHGWTPTSVARVEESGTETTVFVSLGNAKLEALVQRARRRRGADKDLAEAILNFYVEHVAFHAVLAELGEKQAVEGAAGNAAEEEERKLPEEPESGAHQERELARLAETVCGVIEQVYFEGG